MGANEPFVGEWKLDPSKSKLTDQMKVESVAGNKYAFDFGGGSAETIVPNGTDQPGLAGTTLSITIEAPDVSVSAERPGHLRDVVVHRGEDPAPSPAGSRPQGGNGGEAQRECTDDHDGSESTDLASGVVRVRHAHAHSPESGGPGPRV